MFLPSKTLHTAGLGHSWQHVQQVCSGFIREVFGLYSYGPNSGCPHSGDAIYFIKDLKEEPAPQVDAGFFRQVYGERSMHLSK